MRNGLASVGFATEGLMKRTKFAPDKRDEVHTFSISFRRIESCVRIALMHTGSPLQFPFQISVNPVGM